MLLCVCSSAVSFVSVIRCMQVTITPIADASLLVGVTQSITSKSITQFFVELLLSSVCVYIACQTL